MTVAAQQTVRRGFGLGEHRHDPSALAIGDATVLVDDDPIYTVKQARVGLFQNIRYADYPAASERSRGGRLA